MKRGWTAFARRLLAAFLVMALAPCALAKGQSGHGFSYFGDLKYPADIQHFDYVNPNAPKGGDSVHSNEGNFDSLNPIIRKGRVPSGANATGYIYDHLMERSDDELASYYCSLCEWMQLADDHSWIKFRLRDNAYWHDGEPITVADVLFTFNWIREHGSPTAKAAFQETLSAEITGPREITFHLDPRRATTPNIAFPVAGMLVLPEHYWIEHDLTATTMEIPLASGPYKLVQVDPGRKVVYQRVPDYWGRDLPIHRGRFNIDTVTIEYYNDPAVAHEALKSGFIDIRYEYMAKRWARGYDLNAIDDGAVIKTFFNEHDVYGILSGNLFNLRLPRFQDPRVREALGLAYDFEYANRVLHHGFYRRNTSYFDGSDWVAKGLPSPKELELLEPFRDQLPARLFTEEFQVSKTDGRGYPRENLLRAIELFKEAGWEIRDGVMTNVETGEPFTISFIYTLSSLVRNLKPYARALERMGIATTVKLLEASQYGQRVYSHDFEATVAYFTGEQIPGKRLEYYFSSSLADVPYSLNTAGIKDPVVDFLIARINDATTKEEIATATSALDRVLLWRFYIVPGFIPPGTAYVFWDKYGYPDPTPKYRFGYPDIWWIDPDKQRRVDDYKNSLRSDDEPKGS